MVKHFVLGFLLFISHPAFASTECEIVDALKIVKLTVCEKSTGSVYHSNGIYAGSKGSSWYHSNGTYAGSAGGSWYHSNGNYAGSDGGSWYDADGNYIGSFSDLSENEQLKMGLE